MVLRFNPSGNFEWEDFMNKISIGSMRGPARLLTRIVLQNMWPVNRNSEVTIDRAKLAYYNAPKSILYHLGRVTDNSSN